MADIFIHGATYEAFGVAITEAASTGLPMIVHNGPHFQWVIPNPNCWIDVSRPGALADIRRPLGNGSAGWQGAGAAADAGRGGAPPRRGAGGVRVGGERCDASSPSGCPTGR